MERTASTFSYLHSDITFQGAGSAKRGTAAKGSVGATDEQAADGVGGLHAGGEHDWSCWLVAAPCHRAWIWDAELTTPKSVALKRGVPHCDVLRLQPAGHARDRRGRPHRGASGRPPVKLTSASCSASWPRRPPTLGAPGATTTTILALPCRPDLRHPWTILLVAGPAWKHRHSVSQRGVELRVQGASRPRRRPAEKMDSAGGRQPVWGARGGRCVVLSMQRYFADPCQAPLSSTMRQWLERPRRHGPVVPRGCSARSRPGPARGCGLRRPANVYRRPGHVAEIPLPASKRPYRQLLRY